MHAAKSKSRSLISGASLRHVPWGVLPLLAAFPLLTLFVGIKSLQLRPGGDDYCLAVAAQFGPFGGVAFWWESFSGFLTPSFLANALVGLPLLHLPFGMSSAVTFLTAGLGVGLTGILLIGPSRLGRGLNIVYRAFLFIWVACSTAIAWWSYWWLPVALGQEGDNVFLAQSITHNQNPTAGHVLQTVLVISLATGAIALFRRLRLIGAWILTVTSALAAGFSGPAMGGAYVLAVLALGICFWDQMREIRVPIKAPVIAAGTATVAVVVALMAPGSRARSAELNADTSVSVTALGEILNATFPESIQEWAAAYLSPGAVVAAVLGLVVGYVLWRLGAPLASRRAISTTLTLALFSLFLAILSAAGQVFSYDAFWHFLDNRVAAFFSIVVATVALGQWGASLAGKQRNLLELLVAALGVGLSIGAILTMTISIAERQVVWQQGPAPIEGVVTELLDDTRDLTCWGALSHLREVPARGVTRELSPWDPASGRLMGAR